MTLCFIYWNDIIFFMTQKWFSQNIPWVPTDFSWHPHRSHGSFKKQINDLAMKTPSLQCPNPALLTSVPASSLTPQTSGFTFLKPTLDQAALLPSWHGYEAQPQCSITPIPLFHHPSASVWPGCFWTHGCVRLHTHGLPHSSFTCLS